MKQIHRMSRVSYELINSKRTRISDMEQQCEIASVYPSHIHPFEMWICPANYIMYTKHGLWYMMWVFQPKAQRESMHSGRGRAGKIWTVEFQDTSNCCNQRASTTTGTSKPGDSSHRVGLSSRLVREYAIPKYSGMAIFSGHTGRPTTGRPYTGCVRPGNLQQWPFEFSSAHPSAEF